MQHNTKADLHEHITNNHQRLMDAVAELKPADFNLPVYAHNDPHSWSIHNLLAHLASAYSGVMLTAKAIAAGENPVPKDFNLSRWNQRAAKKASQVPVRVLLNSIDSGYKEWLTFLADIPTKDLCHRGRHPRGDTLTVEGFMRRHAEHEAHHAAEIRAALRHEEAPIPTA